MPTADPDFIARELQRLDLLLHREILRLRARYQLSLDEFRGLYVSDEQADALIAGAASGGAEIPAVEELSERARSLQEINARHLAEAPQWARLTGEFRLGPLEQDILLLALAPEMDPKYETLYGYLNDDISRKYCTVDLALRVLCNGDRRNPEGRAALALDGPLFGQGLLEPIEIAGSEWRSRLAMGFRLPPIVTAYLPDLPIADPRLQGLVTLSPTSGPPDWSNLPLSASVASVLERYAALFQTDQEPKLFVFEGTRGDGRGFAAGVLCSTLGFQLLTLDVAALLGDAASLPAQVDRILTWGRLHKAGLHFQGLEPSAVDDPTSRRALHAALKHACGASVPAILSVTPDTPWRDHLRDLPIVPLRFPEPDVAERDRLWRLHLAAAGLPAADGVVRDVADRFVLNAGQVHNAVAAATLEHRLEEANAHKPLDAESLFRAARAQSVGGLGKLAQKVTLSFGWGDLVLPPVTLQRVREVAAAIRNRRKVYRDWGMERRVNNPNGLMVLFAGASGTGKTMTAGVIAREIGLDLYRIDLSAVVSKYIGETEKNLDRIFAAARSANAILFFDEADALFGKRSEVKDAHDRYANIEVAYLLQKMEEHDGVAILATNLSKNMDQAFSRRTHYVVEFPKPGPEHREQLWRGIFVPQTPLAEDIDFGFLARQFDTTGGEIKNVALDAAFYAADNGQIVGMEALVKAMARQMIREGKLPSVGEFKQFHRLIGQVP